MQASRNGALASEEQTGGLMQVGVGGKIDEGLLGVYLLLEGKMYDSMPPQELWGARNLLPLINHHGPSDALRSCGVPATFSLRLTTMDPLMPSGAVGCPQPSPSD